MVYYFVFILCLSVRLSFCLYVYCVYDLHNNNNNNNNNLVNDTVLALIIRSDDKSVCHISVTTVCSAL